MPVVLRMWDVWSERADRPWAKYNSRVHGIRVTPLVYRRGISDLFQNGAVEAPDGCQCIY